MKKWLILSLCLNFLLIITFIGKRYYFSHSEAAKPRAELPDSATLKFVNAYNHGRVALYNAMPLSAGDVVFLGDSRTEALPLNEYFGSLVIKNRGIGGNETGHIIDRMQPVLDAHPRKIFIEVGVNDLTNHRMTAAQTIAGIDSICARIKASTPMTSVYLESVSPIVTSDSAVAQKINETNILIHQLAERRGYTYIDLYTQFLRNGKTDSALYTDQAHFVGKGNLMIMETLRKYIFSGTGDGTETAKKQ